MWKKKKDKFNAKNMHERRKPFQSLPGSERSSELTSLVETNIGKPHKYDPHTLAEWQRKKILAELILNSKQAGQFNLERFEETLKRDINIRRNTDFHYFLDCLTKEYYLKIVKPSTNEIIGFIKIKNHTIIEKLKEWFVKAD